MFKCSMNHRPDWSTAILAGVIAGTSATLVQVLLWLALTDAFPAILFRDARLTAALVLGSSALPPPATFDTGIMLVATLVHFALSVVYAALLARLTSGLENVPALLAGAAFGIVLYFINLYGFTAAFPWFAQARDWITLIAHAVFGVTVILVCRYPAVKNTQGGS